MKIIKLETRGYKRFLLNNIQELDLTPDKNTVLITGSNGSGKSSLLQLLTPLPVNVKKDFKENGFSKVTIAFKNDTYVCISGVDNSFKYSLLKNNEELNESGTRKVQLKLVEDIFNITPDIHNVMLGTSNVTNMSVNDRKKWFSNISTTDYTYAISVFNKLKTRHRDVVGGIKLLNTKINKDKTEILEKVELQNLLEQRKLLHSTLNRCVDNKLRIEEPTIVSDNDFYNINNKLSKILTSLKLPDWYKYNDETIKLDFNTKLSKLDFQLEQVSKELEQVSTQTLVTNIDINELTNKRNLIKLELTKLISINTLELDLLEIEHINYLFNIAQPEILDSLNSLQEFNHINFTKDEITILYGKEKRSTLHINKITDSIRTFGGDLSTFDSLSKQDNTTCPKCNHSWKIGYDHIKHESIRNKLSQLEVDLKEQVIINTELKNTINDIENKESCLNNLKLKMSRYGILTPVFDFIFSNGFIINIVEDKLFIVNDILQQLVTHPNIIKNLEEVNLEINNYHNLNKELENTKINNKNELEDTYSRLINERNTVRNDLITFNNTNTKVTNINNLQGDLVKLLKMKEKEKEELVIVRKNEFLDRTISVLNKSLTDLDIKLKDNDFATSSLRRNQDELKDYLKRKDALALLVKELSPTDGLIAKSILYFLKDFTDEMNKVISKVWSYDMKVLACDLEGDDLDYKFPVIINNSEVIEDVSKVSSGMKDIIDLAFKITSMKYLNIENYPLFLDEFGRTFDVEHRLKAYNSISHITDSGENQVFVISHFESMYGRFTNVDKIVIDSRNLDFSDLEEYNKILKVS